MFVSLEIKATSWLFAHLTDTPVGCPRHPVLPVQGQGDQGGQAHPAVGAGGPRGKLNCTKLHCIVLSCAALHCTMG